MMTTRPDQILIPSITDTVLTGPVSDPTQPTISHPNSCQYSTCAFVERERDSCRQTQFCYPNGVRQSSNVAGGGDRLGRQFVGR